LHQKIVNINGYDVELGLAEHLVLMVYADRPGIVAVYGKAFADANINIAAMLTLEAHHGRLGAMADMVYAKLNAQKSEVLGKPNVKQDSLLREQLPAWFDAVGKIENRIVSAAFQVMLLTGARPGEVLGLRWEDVNVQWRGLTIRDKVEGVRVISLTAYVQHLLAGLPKRRGEAGELVPFVFSSATSEDGAMAAPRKHHTQACTVAGIEGLTLHGLRRSFKSLTEWLEVSTGVVAQIMGHKPSATAEKHYTVRPLDLLRLHHERIEAWILEQAGIAFDRAAEPGKLRAVA
jgi:integrase